MVYSINQTLAIWVIDNYSSVMIWDNTSLDHNTSLVRTPCYLIDVDFINGGITIIKNLEGSRLRINKNELKNILDKL